MTTLSQSPRRGLTWAVLRLHRVPLWAWPVMIIAGAGGLICGDGVGSISG
ncbi:hypothetical protein [Streptomyces sp900116325]